MLHLDTQKGKGAMKTSTFQKYIEGTTACMKRLDIDTIGCSQLTSNNTYFADRWFGSVKTAEDAMAEGVDYFGTMKTGQHGYCLAKSEKFMKDFPGGSYLVMKITPRVPGEIPLLKIGYKHNSRKVLGFIAIEGAGSNEPGDHYLSRLPNIYYNVSVRHVVRPHFLGRYLNICNAIDNQNWIRHHNIALEKYWVTQSGYFRITTTFTLGMGIKYGKLLYCHGAAEGNTENNFLSLEYNNRTVYDCSNNPFTADFGSQVLYLPPITIYDIPCPHKIAQYNPDLIPAAISVASENSVSTLTTPSNSPNISFLMMILTIYIL